MDYQEFLKQWHNDDEHIMVHTSGSTGKPKLLQVEKRRMLESARITCDFLGLQAGNTALLCMPLDYIAGKMMVVRALERGLKLIVVPPSSHPMQSLMGQNVPLDFVAMVPLQVKNTLQVAQERNLLQSTRHLIIGGGAIDAELARQLLHFPNAVWSTYGMTETLSHIALRRLNGPNASEWYTPFDGVALTTDERGCLVIDAPAVCAQRLVTNDRVEFAPNGRQFRIMGRIDNVINSGGIKLQIEEIENKLKKHLKAPFAISKRQDAQFGEIVVLLTEEKDLEAVKNLCSNALTNKYERPRLVVHIDHLPLTDTGKPARQAINHLASLTKEKV